MHAEPNPFDAMKFHENTNWFPLLAGASALFAWTGGSFAQGALGPLAYNTPAYIQFNTEVYRVPANAPEAVIHVIRTGEFRETTWIEYATRDGSASAGEHYVATRGRLEFPAGQSFLSFTVPLGPGTVSKGEKTVQLELFNPAPNAFVTQESAVLIIENPDPGLKVERSADGTLKVSWAAAFQDYIIESNSAAVGNDWKPVNFPVTIKDDRCEVAFPASDASGFFRLIKAE
jgi:hypothetical protein